MKWNEINWNETSTLVKAAFDDFTLMCEIKK